MEWILSLGIIAIFFLAGFILWRRNRALLAVIVNRRIYLYPIVVVLVTTVHLVFHFVVGDPWDWPQLVIHVLTAIGTIEIMRYVNSDDEDDKN